MNTNKSCFDSDKELMIWQDTNCLQCKKAVWYNQRLKKMPQYRCAIQRQIEAQASSKEDVTSRTYDATRTAACPFLAPKDATCAAQEDVLDFSKGESMVKTPLNKEEDEPAAKAEQKTVPNGYEHPNAALLKLASETGIDYNALKDAERRMFDTIKEKAQLPPIFEEARFKKEIKSDVHTMLDLFSWKENMMIAFVPLIISHIAWVYADKVLKCCAELRISETIKLSRAVKKVRQEYIESLKKDLDPRHIERINKQTERFCEEYQNDFVILWYCINSEHKRRYPDDRLTAMRTDAYFSTLMCRYFVEHNKRMDKLIESKMGFAQSIKNPYMDKLETCMDAYCGENTIKNTPNIDACMRVFQKNLDDIEFEVDDSEPK